MTTIVADAIFVAFWLAAQEIVAHISSALTISASDQWMLDAFAIIFAVSTLTPTVIFTSKDMAIMFIRAVKEVRAEAATLNTQTTVVQRDIESSIRTLEDDKQSERNANVEDSEVSTEQEKNSTHAS